jgi:hypothetical protein
MLGEPELHQLDREFVWLQTDLQGLLLERYVSQTDPWQRENQTSPQMILWEEWLHQQLDREFVWLQTDMQGLLLERHGVQQRSTLIIPCLVGHPVELDRCGQLQV